jgi:transcriptional regulator with XRE-family HTH domain
MRTILIKLRKDVGMTQIELAQKLQRPQSFVSKYEQGERRLDFVELLEVLEQIGVSIYSFIEKYQEETPKE